MKDNGSAPAIGVFWTACLDCWRVSLSLAENAEAGASPGSRRFRLFSRLPVPRQQRFEFVPFGPPGDNSFNHIGQPGQRFDAVQFCRLDQRRDDGPVPSAVVVASEKRILSCYRYGSDGALDCVGIELQPAILEG